MQVKGVLIALLGLSAISEAAIVRRHPLSRALQRRQFGGGNGGNNRGNNGGNNGGNNNGGGGGTTLDQSVIQTGSQQDGNDVPADGQSASAT